MRRLQVSRQSRNFCRRSSPKKKKTVSHPLYARAADFAPSAQLTTVRLTPIRMGHGPNRESPARLWPAARAAVEFAPSSPEGRARFLEPTETSQGCNETMRV